MLHMIQPENSLPVVFDLVIHVLALGALYCKHRGGSMRGWNQAARSFLGNTLCSLKSWKLENR